MAKWVFTDPVDSTSYTFDINPNQGGSPSWSKSITYENTSAPDGKTLMFEGRDEVKSLSFSGTILEEEQYDAMIEWFGKRHAIMMTDDLGRTFNIYITGFNPTRERAVHYPWKHSYEVNYTILDWS